MTTRLVFRNQAASGTGIVSGMQDMLIDSFGSATDVLTTAPGNAEGMFSAGSPTRYAIFVSGYTPPAGFTLTSVDISIWGHESAMTMNHGGRARIFKLSAAGVETELGGSPVDDGVEFSTSATEMTWTANVTDTVFDVNDRLVVKIYSIPTGGTGGAGTSSFTYNGQQNGTGDAHVIVAETVAFSTHPFPSAPSADSPADGSNTTDTTPSFEFTGTIPDGHGADYNIQISRVSTFGIISEFPRSAGGGGQLYHLGNPATNYTAYGMSFTGNGEVIKGAAWFLAKNGSPTGTVVAKIYAHSGTFGTSSIPTGSALATSDSVDVATLTSDTMVRFSFTGGNQITLTNGTNYVVVVEYTGGATSNYLYVYGNGASVAGNGSRFVSPTWTQQVVDYEYAVYSTFPEVEQTGNNTYFVNPDNGADTYPWTSGENIKFTVPTALVAGVYYWRVRTRDQALLPSMWSSWSVTRSIILAPTAPTLNSPADSASLSDLTPTFDFTGTGLGGSLEYEIGISETTLVSKEVVEEQEPSGSASEPLNTTYKGVGQAFTGNGSYLESIQWVLRRASSPTGTLYVKVYAHSGTFGTDSVPTGSPLAVSEDTMDVSTLATVDTYYTFSFSGVNQILLEDGVHYIATVEYSEAVSINHVTVRDVIGGTLEGTQSRQKQSDSLWEFTGTGASAFVITINGKPLIYAQSELGDSGFVNPDVGGDTHPFNSGENIQYTVQTVLDPGTYYWGVRTRDVSGMGNDLDWSPWSSTRSFTITTADPLVGAYWGNKNTLV